MPDTVASIIAAAEQLWPTDGAEDWDAIGLLVGDRRAPVSQIHLAVEATPSTAQEAIELGAELLFVHHPLLLRGVTSVAEDHFKGAVVSQLIRAGCALYSAHTNADTVESGTSAVLAAALDIRDTVPIVAGAAAGTGIGRAGRLGTPLTLGRLARALAGLLPATASGIRVAGDYDRPVEYVAVCAGAGDSYLGEAVVLASDVYITSDLRHHPASAFRENAVLNDGPALIDVSHWASEWLWLDTAAKQLRAARPGITVTVSELRTDPWDFTIVQ